MALPTYSVFDDMLGNGPDIRGYDPYNHTGRQVRRRMMWDALHKELMPKPLFRGMDFGREAVRERIEGDWPAEACN